ncbi:hypothetical protein B0T19DRAFT_397056 [Cercophora scortea]|uniref:Zinc finger C2H2 LYAR-type domain-containing protein n=1 Tax=Cercophora scortea TaxID=314031 RepID=A0AAE0J5R4_9PEZI|nr:hypothetical protein B0T19DRAFT_397056 [Cercophora scortea]
MVSFSCESCGDIFTKKKLDPHRNRCRGATFTCIDCMVYFPGVEYRNHTSCMSEEQKYQGALYRNKKAKTTPGASTPAPPKPMAQPAYVEDVADDYESWRDYEDANSPTDLLPEAPTPPSANDPNVNVFDFYVGVATPTASNVSLPAAIPAELSDETQLVRFDREANASLNSLDDMDADSLVQYGTGPVPTSSFVTPAPKALRKKSKDSDKDAKKDKKRKRLHIETDQIMTDAPPVLHSGLTGGLNRLMSRPSVFPPSPDYSGGDVAETPASPLKKSKSKHHKSARTETIGNSLMAMIAGSSKPKVKKRKSTSSTSTSTKKKSSHKRLEAPKEQKLLEYPKDTDASGQMVVYKPRAELFLGFVNKGPESERGCSMNKALKRFHRERSASDNSLNKLKDEKELWRSLRMKKNERGEIVLFCA